MLDSLWTLAQAANQDLIGRGLAVIGIGIGFGFSILGAGIGIGRAGGDAVQAIARQPESVGPIGTNMIIAAALIEGLAIVSMVLLAFVIGAG